MRVLTGSHPPSVSRCTSSIACSVVDPVPRFFGRTCSGRRVIRSRSPPMVTSQPTSVRTPAAAWSLRRRFSCPRGPGTEP